MSPRDRRAASTCRGCCGFAGRPSPRRRRQSIRPGCRVRAPLTVRERCSNALSTERSRRSISCCNRGCARRWSSILRTSRPPVFAAFRTRPGFACSESSRERISPACCLGQCRSHEVRGGSRSIQVREVQQVQVVQRACPPKRRQARRRMQRVQQMQQVQVVLQRPAVQQPLPAPPAPLAPLAPVRCSGQGRMIGRVGWRGCGWGRACRRRDARCRERPSCRPAHATMRGPSSSTGDAMFTCLYSLSTPLAALLKLAADFTPRFEVVGPLVMLDVSGLSRLFGPPREIAAELRRAAPGPLRIAMAPTQTAAALLALGRPGVTIVAPDEQSDTLAPLPVSLLGEFERLRLTALPCTPCTSCTSYPAPSQRCRDGRRSAVLPIHSGSNLGRCGSPSSHPVASASARAESSGELRRDLAEAAFGREGGPSFVLRGRLDPSTRRARRAAHAPRTSCRYRVTKTRTRACRRTLHLAPLAPLAPVSARARATELAVDDLLLTLRRWGVKTFGQLAALPTADVYERLGARGVTWQRLARGEDLTPLVPWVPDDPFDASLDLEWPIEGLEPLSFVLARLLEPLSEQLERADRGAAVLQTHLRLIDKSVHVRTLQLPAPMRDPKTLRTLLLLDLESHPPTAAIDRVRVVIEPTPARVTQWALFERAQPSPEQVSTLLARLTALMGESHVGSPQLIDSWRSGAFEMIPFEVRDPATTRPAGPLGTPRTPCTPCTRSSLRPSPLPPPRSCARSSAGGPSGAHRHGSPGDQRWANRAGGRSLANVRRVVERRAVGRFLGS